MQCGLSSSFPGLGSTAETRTTAETLNHMEIWVVRWLGRHFRRLKILLEVPSIVFYLEPGCWFAVCLCPALLKAEECIWAGCKAAAWFGGFFL